MSNDNKYQRAEIASQILERSPAIGIRVDERREQGTILFITENVSAFGYERDEFLSGKIKWLDIIHPDDLTQLVATINTLIQTGNERYSITYRVVKKDGAAVWVLESGAMIRDADGNVAYSDCVITDYSETRYSLERIGENSRQQSILNEILHGLHGSDPDKALQIILDTTGASLGISRVALFEDFPDHQSCRVVHEWCNRGVPSLVEQGDYTLNYRDAIPDIAASLNAAGRSIVNYGEIPLRSRGEFEAEGVLASAVYRVKVDGEPYGFICFDECVRERVWSDDVIRFLDNLRREGVRNESIVLEITEGMAIQDLQRMKMLANELRRAGVWISMDDFGTGYSSLGNLRELPIDVVKIDRSFIHDVTTDPYSKSFIRFITDLVHAIGRKICIEGVETAAQFKYCQDCHADYVQGFHLWRPMPEEELLSLLEAAVAV